MKSSPKSSTGRKSARTPQRRDPAGAIVARARVPIEPIYKGLCSYHYFRKRSLKEIVDAFSPIPCEIIADSGAFSAWSLAESVTLDGYMRWLDDNRRYIKHAVVLDDLMSAEVSQANQVEMERGGFDVRPVFHYGEDFRVLDSYMERHSYIFLGGMAGVRERSWTKAMPWLIQCFKRAVRPDGSVKAVFHGLGVSAQVVLNSLPWYSSDASTYINAERFGMIGLFDRHTNSWEFVRSNGENITPRHLRLLRAYGLSETLLRDVLPDLHAQHKTKKVGERGSSPYSMAMAATGAGSWPNYEAYLRERHGLIDVPGRPDLPPGIRYYLAMNTARTLERSGWEYGIKKVLKDAMDAAA